MKLFLLLRYSFVILCFLLPKSVWAADSPNVIQLLNQMTQSFETLSYDGIFVHSESMRMNSMRVRHLLVDGRQYESLEDLDGDKVEVLRIGNQVICVYPDASMMNTQQQIGLPFKRFKKLESSRLNMGYNMEVDREKSRIAGRSAIQVRLIPKDHYRYGHVFWLDEGNGFLLKHDLITPDGNLLERIQFTSVNFSPDLKQEDFTPTKGSYSKHTIEKLPEHTIRQWKFDWLPAGFSLVWNDARILQHGVHMLLLSDGMATISVFVEPGVSQKPLSILGMGATIAGEKSVRVGKKLYLLTMVGEVPVSTIEKLMSVMMPRSNP